MKVYTRTGDNGNTSLADGTRILKSDCRLEAYGTLDELNAQVGLLGALLTDAQEQQLIEQIQNTLFSIGAQLASPCQKEETAQQHDHTVEQLEKHIDDIQSVLPPLHDFILPAGNRAAIQAHICRTVCRRFERRLVELAEQGTTPSGILCFSNRLSDYFFVLARKINFLAGITEKKWQKTCK
ncbi:MAG TPA: cob(I)yrinic acid a,c-diamide adenosyltransferase [Prevotella sp.]